HQGWAVLERLHRVLELERLVRGASPGLNSWPVDRIPGLELGVGMSANLFVSDAEAVGVAAIDLEVPPVEILQPRDRRACLEAVGEFWPRPTAGSPHRD